MAADNTKPPPRSDKDKEALRQLNETADRILKSTPENPYYLTVPTERPYNYSTRQESESWMLEDLFEPHEEGLQYSTFLFHEHGKDLLVCRSEVDDERDRKEKIASRKGRDTEENTPSHATGPKKKISLSSYLKKSDSPAPKQPEHKDSAKAAQPQINGTKDTAGASVNSTMSAPQPKQKRQREDPSESKKPVQTTKDESALSKKQKQHKDSQRDPSPSESHSNPDPTRHGLPALLSPIHASESSDPFDLPPLLSPTLPSVVQLELEKLQKDRQHATSNASSSSEKRPPGQSNDISEPKEPNDGSLKKDATESNNHKKEDSKQKHSTHHLSKSVEETQPSKPSFIAKLKYGKRNKLAIERVLKLPPNKLVDGRSTANGNRPRADSVQKDISRKTVTTGESSKRPPAEKRPRAEDDSTTTNSTKRQKVSSKVPSTPTTQAITSPPPSAKSSSQKQQTQFLTPRKDPRISKVIGPHDSTTSTPGEPSLSSISTSNSHEDDSTHHTNAWREKSQAFSVLGRRLKHEAQRLYGDGHGITTFEKEKSAVISIECIL